jgi:SAM-dependent methyltransferase
MSLRDRGAALAYGTLHDHVVSRFAPYRSLMELVTGYVMRSTLPRVVNPRVLDVSCGTGTLARRLANAGCHVVGIDPIAPLVQRARRRTPAAMRNRLVFHHRDIALQGAPAGDFDIVVSLHTLYWHSRPYAVLEACRRALKPGGIAIVLAYARPTTVVHDFLAIRTREGLPSAARALGWLVPTVLFERLRDCRYLYFDRDALSGAVVAAGFRLVDCRPALFDGLSNLVLAQAPPAAAASGTTSQECAG